jgi:hypothetical protein
LTRTQHIKLIGTGAFLAALALGIGYYMSVVYPTGELGQKKAWSVLQSVELEHRGDNGSTPILLKHPLNSDYTVLGLPTNNSKYPHAWIILNEKTSDSSFKVLPQKIAIHVDCEYVANLVATVSIEPPVVAYLNKLCSPPFG